MVEATTTPPFPIAEQSPIAKEVRVESSYRVDGTQGALPVIEATEEVADTPLEMPD